jgi:N6-adenosine-specific RNA methylase IME4
VPVIERSVGMTQIDYYYDSMTIEQIGRMPIKEITEKDSVCFMWVTVPLLPEGLATLNKWGFKYKTMITWHKTNSKGMGYWFRGFTEHLLLGVKGNVRAFKCLHPNIYESKFGKHSQKPQHFRDLISKAITASFSEPKKLELFARSREGFFPDYEYEGWDVYGNQVNGSIE